VSCLFCEIVAGRVPAKVAYQDEQLLAFHDVNPQGPTHILVVPRRHITSLLDMSPADDALVGSLVRRARGEDAGYSVYHIHLHLVGGRKMGWPPG
jgi:histidine triad (HIT) family protein